MMSPMMMMMMMMMTVMLAIRFTCSQPYATFLTASQRIKALVACFTRAAPTPARRVRWDDGPLG